MTNWDNIIMGLGAQHLTQRFDKIREENDWDIHPSSRGGALAYMEREEPVVLASKPQLTERVLGDLRIQGSEIKIYADGDQLNGTMEAPGMDRYRFNFVELMAAEGIVSSHWSKESEFMWGRHLYSNYLESMREVCFTTNDKWTYQYRYAASPVYDAHGNVIGKNTFVILFWDASKLDTMLIVNGTDAQEVPLKYNEHFNSTRAPKWLGKVPAFDRPR